MPAETFTVPEQPKAKKQPPKAVYTGLGNSAGRHVIEGPIRDYQDPDNYYSRGIMKLHDEAGTESDNIRLHELKHLRDELRAECEAYILDYLQHYDADIDIDAIAGRLDIVSMTIADSADVEEEQLSKQSALFQPANRKTTVFLSEGFEGYRDTTTSAVVHELLHGAASVVYATNPKLAEIGQHRTVTHGLSRGKKFEWLDEAVTQKLTRLICSKNQISVGGSYGYEVRLLEEIVKVSGISLKTFVEAYFEEVDLDAEPGQRMAKWHALQQALNTRFGTHFLERIEQELEKTPRGLSNEPLLKKDEDGRSGVELMFEDWRDRKN